MVAFIFLIIYNSILQFHTDRAVFLISSGNDSSILFNLMQFVANYHRYCVSVPLSLSGRVEMNRAARVWLLPFVRRSSLTSGKLIRAHVRKKSLNVISQLDKMGSARAPSLLQRKVAVTGSAYSSTIRTKAIGLFSIKFTGSTLRWI